MSAAALMSVSSLRTCSDVSPPGTATSPRTTSSLSTVSTSRCTATLLQPVEASHSSSALLEDRRSSGENVVRPHSAISRSRRPSTRAGPPGRSAMAPRSRAASPARWGPRDRLERPRPSRGSRDNRSPACRRRGANRSTPRLGRPHSVGPAPMAYPRCASSSGSSGKRALTFSAPAPCHCGQTRRSVDEVDPQGEWIVTVGR
jgi:hypothetical protein